jgi:hypothetical protein
MMRFGVAQRAGFGVVMLSALTLAQSGQAAETVGFQVPAALTSGVMPSLSRALAAALGADILSAADVKAPAMISLRQGKATDAGGAAPVGTGLAGLFGTAPMVLVSRASLPILDAAELVAEAKKPGASLRLAVGAAGTPSAACAALVVEQLPGLKLVSGDVDTLKALTEERADLACVDALATVPLARAGRITAQIVASEDRLPALWDVSTGPELGLALFTATAWFGLYTTPMVDTAKVHAGLQAYLADDANVKQMSDAGVTPFPLTHRTLDAHRAIDADATR